VFENSRKYANEPVFPGDLEPPIGRVRDFIVDRAALHSLPASCRVSDPLAAATKMEKAVSRLRKLD